MGKTDKEVLELCKAWFEDIMERSDKLTSGNVSHGSRAIHGVAKNYAEYIDEHLHNRLKPSDEHYELEEFAKIVRGNLTGISKDAQELFKAKYLQLTGNKMYGGFIDQEAK